MSPATRSPTGHRRARFALPAAGGAVTLLLLAPAAPAAGQTAPGGLPLPTLPASPPTAVQPPDLVQAPAIPAQPGAAARPCTHASVAPGSWRMLAWSTNAFEARVDPWNPCVMYRAANLRSDGSTGTLQRTSDDGATWQTVFHDDATGTTSPAGTDPSCALPAYTCSLSTEPFAMSGITVPRPGVVELGEQSNGDAVVASNDDGRTWSLANHGIAGQSVRRVLPAPGDGSVEYALTRGVSPAASGVVDGAVTGTNGATGFSFDHSTADAAMSSLAPQLYRTHDAGASWAAVTLPLAAQTANDGDAGNDEIQVDPDNPNRLWAVIRGWAGNQPPSAPDILCRPGDVFESTDGGASWGQVGALPVTLCSAPELVVIRSPSHPLRLAVSANFASFPSAVALSDDGGSSWHASAVPAPQNPSAALVADPADQDALVWLNTTGVGAGGNRLAWVSEDGLDHATAVPFPALASGASATIPGSGFSPSPFGGAGTPPEAVAADEGGTFYVNLAVSCFFGLRASSTTGACNSGGGGTQGPTQAWTLWEFRLPAAAAAIASPPAPPPAGLGPQVPIPLTQFTPCSVPLWNNGEGPAGDQSGTVAFDGRDLLFTQLGETLSSYPPRYVGVIHALDPTQPGCPALSDIDVSFDPRDIATWNAMNGAAIGQPPPSSVTIEDLTYDAHRNALWISISPGHMAGAGQEQGLFLVDAIDGSTSPRTARARLVLPRSGCGWVLSYDVFRDVLWTCAPGGASNPGATTTAVSPVDGSPMSTCETSFGLNAGLGAPGLPGYTGMGTWTLGGQHHLYVALEDDETIADYDPDTCTLQHTYVHRLFAEALAEDDQMACDPLTYGPDGLPGVGAPSTVLWLRDAQAFSISPYAIPQSGCPMPTATTYAASSTPGVVVGGAVQLCATLRQLYPGGSLNLRGLPVSFTLSGPASVTVPGWATTGGDRTTSSPGCTSWSAAVPPGTYRVTAHFDPVAAQRTEQYLPSAATGTLVVAAPASPLLTGPSTGALLQPPPPPNQPLDESAAGAPAQPAPYSQVQAAEQAEAQAQSQSQAQAQSVAQAQPGVMVQRRTRQQVAAQTVRQGPAQTETLLATRRRQSPPELAFEFAAGALLLLVGVIARRPAPSFAEVRRRRSEPRQRTRNRQG